MTMATAVSVATATQHAISNSGGQANISQIPAVRKMAIPVFTTRLPKKEIFSSFQPSLTD